MLTRFFGIPNALNSRNFEYFRVVEAQNFCNSTNFLPAFLMKLTKSLGKSIKFQSCLAFCFAICYNPSSIPIRTRSSNWYTEKLPGHKVHLWCGKLSVSRCRSDRAAAHLFFPNSLRYPRSSDQPTVQDPRRVRSSFRSLPDRVADATWIRPPRPRPSRRRLPAQPLPRPGWPR